MSSKTDCDKDDVGGSWRQIHLEGVCVCVSSTDKRIPSSSQCSVVCPSLQDATSSVFRTNCSCRNSTNVGSGCSQSVVCVRRNTATNESQFLCRRSRKRVELCDESFLNKSGSYPGCFCANGGKMTELGCRCRIGHTGMLCEVHIESEKQWWKSTSTVEPDIPISRTSSRKSIQDGLPLGIFLLVVLIIGCAALCARKRRKRRPVSGSSFQSGNFESVSSSRQNAPHCLSEPESSNGSEVNASSSNSGMFADRPSVVVATVPNAGNGPLHLRVDYDELPPPSYEEATKNDSRTEKRVFSEQPEL